MTAKTPKDEDPDIIEGVAVEKTASSTRRGRRGAKAGAAGRKSTPDAPDTGNDTADAAGRTPRSTRQDAAARRMTGGGLPVMISSAVILLLLVLAGYQVWQSGRSETALRAEITAMAGQLDSAQAVMSQLRRDIDAQRAGRAALAGRIDGVEAALPVDPSAELAALATRLEKLEEATRKARRAGASGMPQMDGESALAHAAMAAAAAMTLADAGGGDAAQWVPVLHRVSQAGLDLGDLGRLEALVLSRPPSSAALLAGVAPLVEMMRTGTPDASGTGWWDSATGRIGDFIRFRRSDEGVSSNPNTDAGDDPLRKLQRVAATGDLQAALEASRAVTTSSAPLRRWQESVARRLELDAALAGLSAAAISRLVASGDQG